MAGELIPNMLHLSRVEVSGRAGIYSVHKLIHEAVGKESRPLWRLCSGYALVLSPTPVSGCPSRVFEPSPLVGQETRFDLLAEVSISRKKEGALRSKRVDPILEARFASPTKSYAEITREVGGAWLDRQGLRLGFEVLSLQQADYQVIEFMRRGQPIRLGAVRFAGRLRITDADAFKSAMQTGIGHSKAWGCGLLLCFGE